MKLPLWLKLVALASIGFLYLPLVAVAFFSFNNARYVGGWQGFTLKWYDQLFHNRALGDATVNTLFLAGASTAIATAVGTALGIALERTPWTRRQLLMMDAAMQLPVVTPDIILAAALVVAFGTLRSVFGGSGLFEPGMPTMVLGHVTFQIAFVALVVRGRLATMGPVLEEAARDLYAEGWSLFRRVTLPLVAPGVVAGAMLAFTLSLDDFVISYFTAGPESGTLPIYIYSALRRGLSPELHALSTLLIFATVVLVLATERLTRHGMGKEKEGR